MQLFSKIGATSLLNVTCLAPSVLPFSAACATNSIISEPHTTLALRFNIAASLDTDLHFYISPTAVIPEISGQLTGAVIHHDLQHVLAGGAELRGGCCPAVHDLCARRIEHHGARPSIFAPHGRHPNWLSRAHGKTIIGRRNCQRKCV